MQENLSFCKYVVDKLASSNTTPTFTSTQADEQILLDNLNDRQRIIYKILDTQI